MTYRVTRGIAASAGLLLGYDGSLAREGYERFDKREAGWTKVLLHPTEAA
ncbi:hypothetical protein [Actinopolymorpha rutila]|uniref:Uncharacterized protein n=1 Tax=Actinopolymorpha rutila TaxID=446787 RepID=A0A852ZMX2_9ACTN|nr:hypothetical protein [Actinopolymorpha rutila]